MGMLMRRRRRRVMWIGDFYGIWVEVKIYIVLFIEI